MNYLLKSSNRDRRRTFRTVMIALAVFLAILLVHAVFPRLVPSMATAVSLPFWRAENTAVREGSGTAGYFMSKRLLDEENSALKEENASLKTTLAGFALLQEENKELKELMGRAPEGKAVLAAILKKPPVTPYDTLIVDAGENLGIAKGNKVMVGGNGMAGEVEEVLGRTSKVRLYSTHGEKTDIELGTTTVQAVAVGRGGGNFEAVVPRDARIAPGEIVILPGMRQQVFGIVESSVMDSARAYQKVLFRSPYSLFQIKWVEIIKE